MKIISKFKDYYDYLTYVYGIDNSLVYKRLEFDFYYGNGDIFETKDQLPRLPFTYDRVNTDSILYSWLIVCGKLYVVIPDDGSYFPTKYKLLPNPESLDNWFKRLGIDPIGKVNAAAVELCKKLNSPVFISHSYGNKNKIGTKIPVLDELGFSSFVSPEQIYQEISYFIGNVLRESPDLAQPSKITDKEKILTHGFDLVQSFRKRV